MRAQSRWILRSVPLLTLTLMTASATALIAQDDPPAAEQPADAVEASLPIDRVVLFSSGVGFFQHQGQVEGDAEVKLKFKTDQINDLLKSLVVQDLDGGTISTVNYSSRDPITRTLRSFAIDLTDDPSLANLLRQTRGERVELDGATKIVGQIVSVETRRMKVGDDEFIDQPFVNVLTAEGLRSVSLEAVSRIRFLNEQLQQEFNKALLVLAQSRDVEEKTVGLKFDGEGKRTVRAGYIQETPVWKTSYRLVLADDKQPFLQGWAIVENTTDHDWEDVQLTLVSGRPISFLMDLYEPLYLERPEVQLELFASLVPRTYDQDLAAREKQFRDLADAPRDLQRRRQNAAGGMGFGMGGGGMGGGGGFGAGNLGDARGERESAARKAQMNEMQDDPFGPQQGVQSVAQAAELGEMFEYKIALPVALQRQRSAMLPIVNQEVEGEKVAIYNEAVLAKHPLNGLRLKNTTDLHLMQGPITLFDGGAYAGDAQINDIPAGGERLLSYAVDLNTEVSFHTHGSPEQMLSVKLIDGVLHIEKKHTRSRTYTVKNGNKEPKTVLIEYPYDSQWTLIEPEEPTEKTRNMYRFAVEAKPGEPAKLELREQRTSMETIALSNIQHNTIVYYINARIVSDAIKAALQEVVKRNAEIAETVNARNQRQQRISEIESDQSRIRQNMAQVPRDSDLHRRYLEKFTEQEDSMETLRAEFKELQEKEQRQRDELNEFLRKLTVS